MERRRLDVEVFERGLAPTREKARALILAGRVTVNGGRADKPGQSVSPDAGIEVAGSKEEYVSRGGIKLAGAIKALGLEFRDRIVLDAGASTGGFTDCALKHGAARVYAVDVGYGQMDWRLRNDPRVVVLERTNIRYLDREMVPEPVDIATIDVAFISLTLVLPVVAGFLTPEGEVAALVKPQFEAGREKVGKRGVVRDPEVHREVILRVMEKAREAGLGTVGACHSPIKGPHGNIEFFLHLVQGRADGAIKVDDMVEQAHTELRG